MLSTTIASMLSSPFAVNYCAALCAIATVGGAYTAAMWLSRRVAPYIADLEDNAEMDRRHRAVAEAAEREEAETRGGFTAPTAPAEPNVATFEVPIGAALRQSSNLEFSVDGGKSWQQIGDDINSDHATFTRDGVTVARCGDEAVATAVSDRGPIAVSLVCPLDSEEQIVVADKLCAAAERLRSELAVSETGRDIKAVS